MKKIIILTSLVVVMGMLVINKATSSKSNLREFVNAKANAILPHNVEVVKVIAPPLDIASPVVINWEELSSVEELRHNYLNFSAEELEVELKKSTDFVTTNNLINKNNMGEISESEITALAFELRKQTAIHTILLERSLSDGA